MNEPLPQIGDWSSFEELLASQDKQMAHVLERAGRSPLYARRFATEGIRPHAEDFDRIPLTTKEDLAASYPFDLLAVPMEQLDCYFESSGTTGRPTPAYYTRADWTDLAERFSRKTGGIVDSDVLFVRSPYALGMAAHLAAESGRANGATVIPGDNRSSLIPYARVVRILHDLGITLTWSNPTDCLMWAASARLVGLDPATDFPALRALYVGGEPLSPARKERISQIWGVPVLDEYGCSELGSLAGRCPAGRLHLWADRVKAEIFDPATRAVSPYGTGELVLTPLYLEAMPLVRYNVRDWVRLTSEECECGWHLPIVEVVGRSGQGYPIGPEGRLVTQIEVEQVVFGLPARLQVLFWRSRAELDHLQMQVEAPDELAGEAGAALRDAIAAELRVACEIEVVPPGTLVPHDLLADPVHSLKPCSLYGPGESWDQALVFSRG